MCDLVTGSGGFLGQAMFNLSLRETIFASRNSCSESNERTKVDLTSVDAIVDTLKRHKIKRVFHLVGTFSNNFDEDFQVNVSLTRNLLEAVTIVDKSIRVLLVGSAAEYGLIGSDECPVSEDAVLKPASVYALTKVYQTQLMEYYVSKFGLDIVMARPFNLLGKNCSEKLFVGRLYSQIKQFKNSEIDVIKLGNLSASRDYIKVEEAAKHLVKIMDCGVSGQIYNVASGVPIKIEDLLTSILKEESVSSKHVLTDDKRTHISDVDMIFADISKLKELYND
ncbi:NAD-dependent epimerase/dehydratase family protein [Vibrio fluvialis]|uniref:NAD-dependent epimerase/dehydratase family protein n=2 Tax=Vibrio fluvialis TaxID=676 RepID=UPI001C9C7E07|nr:NAD-dependent epimerase/dehydratase family protein [Vibrio fluvialis]EKO5124730.1 NAD-dependent epimerase/dehydratase family protein [Vibrio fluvialis]MBY7911382.1 NAD-dependent epimerase/dehydratase family protein [Vibrio fluvialis]MBY7954338.1 NAD-dependent epimerase/dehydratase family protein [Vibrio fluvialis]MBY8065454.1 NAD-dependent epimerase/dehydratase family protein [Vibrio fluvialis]MBY8134224.1 NAD-dependent epimerase/dehydratase family protein [Vibrio fluvialis]